MKSHGCLDDEFDLAGAFWLPGSEERHFSGRLTRFGNQISLVSSADYGPLTDRRLFSFEPPTEKFDFMFGFTREGPCTLVGVFHVSDGGLQDYRTAKSLRVKNYRVRWVIFGIHSVDGMKTAVFEYPNLRYWIFASPETSHSDNDLQLAFRPLEPVLKVSSLEQQATLSLGTEIKVRFTAKREVRSRTTISVRIECLFQNPLAWFIDIAYRLENFFSLFLGFSCPLKRVQFSDYERATTLNGGLKQRRGKTDQLVIVRANQQQLTIALLRWLSFQKEFRSFESLVYGTVRRSKLFVETEFLALSQALEGFHRLTSTKQVADSSTFKAVRRILIKVIDRCCQDGALKQRLRESLEHANDISFGNRMIDLFSRVSPENLHALIGNSLEFEKQVKSTRNYLTHIGGPPTKTVLTDVSDIFGANQKLHGLLRLLVFLELGISEYTAFEPVNRQAQKWK
jgi:hypothetical protein